MAYWLMQGREYQGDGDPNGVVAETRGASFWRRDGGPSTTLYVKESDDAANDWVAYGSASGGPASQLDANGTTLDVNVIGDGTIVQRSGATIVGTVPIANIATAQAAADAAQSDADAAGTLAAAVGSDLDTHEALTTGAHGMTAFGAGLVDSADAAAGRAALALATIASSGSASDLSAGTVPEARLTAASTTAKGIVELATDGEAIADRAVQGNDARMSNARTPTAHASTHVTGGSDVIAVFDTDSAGLVPASGGSASEFLSADGTFKVPSGGSDPWTYVALASDFTTTSGTAVNVTGLLFTPAANLRYEFEVVLFLQTATNSVGPRPGLAAAPTGLTRWAAWAMAQSSATAFLSALWGSTAAAVVVNTGVPTANVDAFGAIRGALVAGASPSGNVQVTLLSETAGTTVRVMAGSFLKWRTF